MAFQDLEELLKSCGLEAYLKAFVDAGFTKVLDLVNLVTDWKTQPEKKELFNTLCQSQIGLSGMKRLKFLNALKAENVKSMPSAMDTETPKEEEDQKDDPTPGAGDGMKGEKACPGIDLAFVLDTTGSMGSYISSAQRNIRDIVKNVEAAEHITDVRFALVSYKDYNKGDTTKLVSRHGAEVTQEDDKPQESGLLQRLGSLFGASTPAPKKKRKGPRRSGRSSRGYHAGNGFPDGTAARIYDFTADIATMQSFVDEQRATGGGDGPEAVATALDCCEHLSWREGAVKIAILIADAPPHGIEKSGDNFPDGDPIDRDALTIARALADKDITIYTVACEPSVTNSWQFCRDFMEGVAEIGGGMLVPLSDAQMLTQMVLASCKEGADLEKIQNEMRKELEKLSASHPGASQDQLAEMCSTNMAARGVRTAQMMDTANAYESFNKTNVRRFAAKDMTLRSAKSALVPTPSPANWDRGMKEQRVYSRTAMVSKSQCSRMMKKKCRSWNLE